MTEKTLLNAPKNLSKRKTRLYEFMRANPVAVLSTITPEGEPHAVVVYYVPDKELNAYFMTRERTRKCVNLSHKNVACLTSCNPKHQSSLQIIGHCSVIKDARVINRLAAEIIAVSMLTSGQQLPPISKLTAGPYIGYKITPNQMRLATYSASNTEIPRELFESIESVDLDP